jgi:2-polyprenyl-3-methyl-5-hydroxy-6-metoxy-1,4-benzoquinol methylase
MKQWYEELFTNYANNYDRESFTRGTIQEVDFIEAETGGDRSRTILDVGCGTGRHAIELARRGYRVTGIDLSADQLKRAKEKAKECGVAVEFLQRDARAFDLRRKFDLVIMLCEGAFSLMETDEMNYAILQNIVKSLNPGGKLIFTTLSALFPLYHSVRDFINQEASKTTIQQNTFDLMTFRDHSTITSADDDGLLKELVCNERYYTPSEITWLLKSLQFKTIDIFGAALGQFSRSKALTTEDFEMLVIARK